MYPYNARSWVILMLLVVSLGSLPELTAIAQSTPSITAFDWNADGTLLAIGRHNGTVTVVDTQDVPVHTFTLQQRPAHLLIAWHPVDPNVLAINAFQGPIKIFNFADERTLEIMGRENIATLAWSPDGTYLATVGESEGIFDRESALEIWDANKGDLHTAYEDGFYFTDCAWNPMNNGQILVTGLLNSGDTEFVLWDSGMQSVLWIAEGVYGASYVAWAPDGAQIVTANYTSIAGEVAAFVELRDLATGNVATPRLPTSLRRVSNVLWAPGPYLIITNTGQMEIWEPDTATLIASFETAQNALAWTPDATQLAYVSETDAGQQITFYDVSPRPTAIP